MGGLAPARSQVIADTVIASSSTDSNCGAAQAASADGVCQPPDEGRASRP